MTEKVNQQPHSSKRRISSRSKPKSSTANVGYTTLQPQRPITENRDAWHAYWQALNQPWRTEPEIDEMRQAYLAKRRNITPNKEQGISPFKDIKLSRADIEWLLAAHEDGRGPVDWSDEQQRNRKGLDLAGADVRNANLSGLPLSRMNGFGWARWTNMTDKQIDLLTIHLEGANLSFTHLEGANLFNAYLGEAYAYGVRLEEALLSRVCLQGACLNFAHLEKAVLISANLEKASLKGAHLEGANIDYANLDGTILSEAFFDRATQLKNVVLNNEPSGAVSIVDIRWGDVNLAVMSWSKMKMLGDEREARQRKDSTGNQKDRATQIAEYETAVRANNQLSTALRSQGMNEQANHFAYRAQVCSQPILFLQLLQNISKQEKLRWLMHTTQKPSDYLNLLAVATMMLVCTFVMWLVLTMVPRLASTFGGHSAQVVSGVIWLVSGVLFLSILVTYQPLVRLLLLFLLLSTLDLMLLYLVLLILVATLLNSTWQIDLLLLFLLILMLSTILWEAHTTPEERIHGLDALLYGIAMLLWEKVIISSGRYLYSWLLPFAQLQVDCGRYIFSLFLNTLAGYGYRPGRSLFWYLVIIFGFATAYHTIGNIPLLPNAFVLSLTSFHGRGFLPGLESKTTLDNPLVVLAAIEAVVGLFIEISFIATFTKRFFGS